MKGTVEKIRKIQGKRGVMYGITVSGMELLLLGDAPDFLREGALVEVEFYTNDKGTKIVKSISKAEKKGGVSEKDLSIAALSLVKSWLESPRDADFDDVLNRYKQAYEELLVFHAGDEDEMSF